MQHLKKILFVIPSLQGGGAERVVSAMASFWAQKNLDITILTLAGPEVEISYPVSQKVKILPLSILGKKANALNDNFERIKKIHQVLKNEKPDIIISFMESTNILSILASCGLKISVIISDRIDPHSYTYGLVWRMLRNVTYPFAAAFVVQTRGVLARYPSHLTRRAHVITNFVLENPAKNNRDRQNVICAMGRLSRQKGFDILLEAFARIAPQFPEWSLEIWGEGEERQALEQQAQNLRIAERVRLPGFSKASDEIMHKARLFVLSSRYEGFPNVLLEAMEAEAPVIATRCPFGPEEIIQNGENGLLVEPESVEALAEAMALMLNDVALRENMAAAAQKTVRQKYNQDVVMKAWEEIICAA